MLCDFVISGKQFMCCDWRRSSRLLSDQSKSDLGFRGAGRSVRLAGGVGCRSSLDLPSSSEGGPHAGGGFLEAVINARKNENWS